MEYCEDGDLFAKISSGNLITEEEKGCYFVQLVHGVQYLHSIGVSHRDLKPGTTPSYNHTLTHTLSIRKHFVESQEQDFENH